MNKAVLLVGMLALTVLSGCLDTGSNGGGAQPGETSAAELAPGFYAFQHRGGALVFNVAEDAHAAFSLYDSMDVRVGRVELGEGGHEGPFQVTGARGEFVLGIDSLDQTHDQMAADDDANESTLALHESAEPILRITSGGASVDTFRPLRMVVERHGLVDRELSPNSGIFPPIGLEPRSNEPLEQDVPLTLGRTPVGLHLLVAGAADELQVTLRGSGGLVLDSISDYQTAGPNFDLLPAQVFSENIRDNEFVVSLAAVRQEGAILLESWTYDRFVPAAVSTVLRSPESAGDGVAFTYGELPQMPVRIEVSDTARHLYVWTEDMAPEDGMESECEIGEPCSGERTLSEPVVAYVSIYDPQDRKLGTFRVESGQQLDVPVSSGGSYVAVAKTGPITIGTDVAPRDFEMHPLETKSTPVGDNPPGSDTRHGFVQGPLNVTGVPFGVRPAMFQPGSGSDEFLGLAFAGCSDRGSIAVFADGALIGSEGRPGDAGLSMVNLHLAPSGLSFQQDGFDGNCGQLGLIVDSFIR